MSCDRQDTRYAAFNEREVDVVNWIKFIAIGLIFVLSLFSFRLALQSVDSSSRRGGLYIGLIIVISVAILSLFQSLFPTSLKLVSEEGEVAEAHSLATLKTATQHFLSDILPRRMSMS